MGRLIRPGMNIHPYDVCSDERRNGLNEV